MYFLENKPPLRIFYAFQKGVTNSQQLRAAILYC